MPKQRALDLRAEGLWVLWGQLPEHCRKEAVVIFARLIAQATQATASQSPSQTPMQTQIQTPTPTQDGSEE